MQQLNTQPIATRPAFVEACPELQAQHRAAQCALFGAARRADLPTSEPFKDAMLYGINAALNFRGSRRLISRRQMSVAEMQAVTVGIEAGLFSEDWTWGNDFTLSISTRLVEVTEVHFAPVAPVTSNDARAFSRLLNS